MGTLVALAGVVGKMRRSLIGVAEGGVARTLVAVGAMPRPEANHGRVDSCPAIA